MKVSLGSDLHLEFGEYVPYNKDKADVLILSGDILVARYLVKVSANSLPVLEGERQAREFRKFLEIANQEFAHVVYVAGNHEFYHGKFFQSLEAIQELCHDIKTQDPTSGLHFLENGSVKISDYLFVGATLWTDMNKGDPHTYHECGQMMNDYRIIVNDQLGYTKLRPAHTHQRHCETLKYFQKTIDENASEKIVVVGHHAPSKVSTKPEYKDDFLINGAYSSDLSEFILDRPQIKLWTHGHTHSEFDYNIGSTRILCNPRGYVNYERGTQENDPYFFKTVELE